MSASAADAPAGSGPHKQAAAAPVQTAPAVITAGPPPSRASVESAAGNTGTSATGAAAAPVSAPVFVPPMLIQKDPAPTAAKSMWSAPSFSDDSPRPAYSR